MRKRQVPASAFDVIARVLTGDRLRPFQPSPQVFPLGDAGTFGIRKDYRARRVEGVLAPERHHGVRAIAEDIARALGAEVVDVTERWGERPEQTDREFPIPRGNTVVVCDDVLQRVNDPGELLARLHGMAADGSVVVVSAPLRSLADSDLDPPADQSIAREWTFPELHACLDGVGLDPLFGGTLTAGMTTAAVGVIVAVARDPND